jgi:hypothetical protein
LFPRFPTGLIAALERAEADCPDPLPVYLAPRGRLEKGCGPESKRNAPDRHDAYPFETRSPSYFRIMQLGLMKIGLVALIHFSDALELELRARYCKITARNRWAKRRMPNAFHWIDENWKNIAPIFDLVFCRTFGRPAPIE